MSVIICAVDLQDSARPVMAVAAALARTLGARLELLHVVHLPPTLPPEFLSEEIVADLRQAAAEVMAARAAKLRATGLEVLSAVELGLVDDCVLKRVREAQANLLVVGTHARGAAAHLFLGSVAERAVRKAPCPVLVVPPAAGGRLTKDAQAVRPLKIVAGIDASPASDGALAWLRDLEQRVPCELQLVHLYWPPREHERLGLGRPDPFEPDTDVIAVLQRDLRAHAGAHLGRDNVALHVRPFWGGEDDLLAWEADNAAADLLVVGTSQTRGSTALATVREARVPVLCIPGTVRPTSPQRLAPVRSVMATTDFSPLGNAAIPEAYRLLLRGGGEVVLFHVAAPGPIELNHDQRNEIETCLLALIPAGMDLHGIRTRTSVAVNAAVGEAIVQGIRREGPDVVVMSSHGRTGLGRAVRGSVAEHVVRESPKPVLVVPKSVEAKA